MWISIHYIWGCPVALPQLSSSFLEMLRTYCFRALQLSQPHPWILSPCISINVHVCVCCARGVGWEAWWPPPPFPPFGWVCHHILKWLVKYLCVWVCPWWRAKIDHFFRWLFGHKIWPNYLIIFIFIWPKGWWLVSIGSSKKKKKNKLKRTKGKKKPK
jgi:hypothetical protein